MFNRSIAIVILLLAYSALMGQTIDVSGTVLDQVSQETIIGANVLVKGTTQGTITDIDGSFEIKNVSPTDILTITYIGYEAQEVSIEGRTQIEVLLGVQANELEEIVVVGYGRQKKKVITGAIASLDAEEITKAPIARVEQVLQGRTAGVQVTNQSGQPGEEPTVRVRGVGTTGNPTPLYIVDGFPVGGIDYLNPGDIETIDVLKDAASAAIYGARAANGVVLITTKGGSEGKMSVTYDAYYGMQNATNKLDMLNADEYKMLMNEGARNGGLTEPFDELEISQFDTDWQDALFQKNVPMQSHQISLSGGTKQSSFLSSMSYFTQGGIIGGEKSQFDRYTARVNANHQANKYIKIGSNLGYTHLIRRSVASNTSFTGAYNGALNLDPLTPVYEERENVLAEYPYNVEPVVSNADGQIYGISQNVGAEIVNPLALLEIDNATTRKDQLVGNMFAEVEPIKNLRARTSFGIDLAYVLDDSFKPLFYLNGAQLNDNQTSVNKDIDRYFTWQWENTLAYDFKINNDHSFGLLAGTTANEFAFEDLGGFNADVPTDDPEHVYLNQATDTLWRSSGGAYDSALFSLFGRVNYSYKDRYSLTTTVRRDGSSKFGENNRYGVFPSIGLAWVISEEPFMSSLGFLNYAKLRGSWGVNGNQEIGNYQFVSSIIQNRRYTFGNGSEVGSSPAFIENADIAWEESRQLNFGLDFGMLENQIQGSLDYYVKTTKGLLERVAIPGHVGNDGPISNVGSVRNEGVELSLNYRDKAGPVGFYVGVNGAYNVNEMTEIGNAEKVIPGAGWAVAGAVTRTEEGLPIAYFWGYQTDGIFQNQAEVFSHISADGELLQPVAVPGDVRFVDTNNDGIINEDDRTFIGNPTPDFTFGLNTSLDYKGVDLSLFFQGALGHQVFNGTQRRDLRFTNRTTTYLDRWTGEGTSNEIPRYTWIDTNGNDRVSDLYVEDASYMRLKNIQIGYTFSSASMKKVGGQSLRVYVSGENVFTLTKYTGIDPEIGAQGYFDSNGNYNAFNVGIDRAIYPQARTFRIGVSLTY